MNKVVVLGATGMLGSMLVKVLSADQELRVRGTFRSSDAAQRLRILYPSVEWTTFDAGTAGQSDVERAVAGQDWAVNAIGITKPLLHDGVAAEVERGIRINALFPHMLAAALEGTGARLLQIATDCVYSGQKGAYIETDVHDALDAYGKTKSLGEVASPAAHHLRCSIIGPENKDFKFLLEWFRRQPRGAQVSGYVNHVWNGVTTMQFGRLAAGIIRTGLSLPHLHHVVPADSVTKAELLHAFALFFDRQDIQIEETQAGQIVDRTLRTTQSELNSKVWASAGYSTAPTVARMIEELAADGTAGESGS